MKLQAQLMHVHLANQVADLQRQLLWDATNHNQLVASHQSSVGVEASDSGSPMRFSPTTWQLEPMPAGQPPFVTRSGDLAAAFAAMPLPSYYTAPGSPLHGSSSLMNPAAAFMTGSAGHYSQGGGAKHLVPSPTSD